jgi:hypothetical protein
MVKLGDLKKKKRFAWLPVKVNKKIIWLKPYVNIYEYKQLKGKRLLPVEGIVREDGRSVYHEIFSKTEIYSYNKWVRTHSYICNRKKLDIENIINIIIIVFGLIVMGFIIYILTVLNCCNC